MKLPIKKKYFDKIKSGEKVLEYRDSHITFICEETGETLYKDVIEVGIEARAGRFSDVLEDDWVFVFRLSEK